MNTITVTNAFQYRTLSSTTPAAPPATAPAPDQSEISHAARAARPFTVAGGAIGAGVGLGLSLLGSFGVPGFVVSVLAGGAIGALLGTSIGIQKEVFSNPDKYPELNKSMRETTQIVDH